MQVACRAMASTAVHVTIVSPTGNVAPDWGAHVMVTGLAPPVRPGAVYVTGTVAPTTPSIVTAAEHEICGGAPGP